MNPFKWIKQAKCLVLTSVYEGFGMVLVEALGLGTQVVAYDCPSGPGEILKKGKLGTLVKIGDLEALSDAIIQRITYPIPENVLMERAQDFSLEKSVNAYTRVIEKLLDKPIQKNA